MYAKMKVFTLAFVMSVVSAASLPSLRCRDSTYRFVGRVNPETKELTWPSTGVAFSFTGTTASININSVRGTASVDLYIDGDEPIVIPSIDGSPIRTPTLPMGNHTVEVRKRSETNFGTFRITNVTTDGTFAPSVAPTRRIEIIGDSISVGYGLDGILPCTDTALLQNNPKTYGAVAAEALGADYSVVAWSGKGLVRNYASNPPDTQPPMPVVYTRYGANDEDDSFTFPSSWVPDAVVINLGTNDFSYLNVREPIDPEALIEALSALIESIHAQYDEAQFFLVSSPMLSDYYPTVEDAQKTTHVRVLQTVIERLDTLKIHFVDWPTQGSDVGCDYHPNEATQAQGAELLIAAIQTALGW